MGESIPDIKVLKELGEYFAAGLYELPNAVPMIRFARAYRRWFESCDLGKYSNQLLFPTGHVKTSLVLKPNYSFTAMWEPEEYDAKIQNRNDPQRETLEVLRCLSLEHWYKYWKFDQTPHCIGGAGYIHMLLSITAGYT